MPAIFVSNHNSALDIPLVDSLLGSYPRIWMSKIEYGKIPVFGYLIKKFNVLVDRFNSFNAARALVKTYSLVKGKSRHVVLFPEGTRSRDGNLQSFFKGFAILAKKLKRPVIPIVISGANKVMPSGSWMIDPRACNIKIFIAKPIFYNSEDTDETFARRVYELFFSYNSKC